MTTGLMTSGIRTGAEVLFHYQQRVTELQSVLGAMQTKQAIAIGIIVLASAIAVAAGMVAMTRKGMAVWYPPLAVAPALLSIRDFGKRKELAQRLGRVREHYRRGVARMEGSWVGQGQAGTEFAADGHGYSGDLHLFGEGSLFERLCTARTHLGRERLARYLQEPVSREEAQQRQASARELRDQDELREQVALLGKSGIEESKGQTFQHWLGEAPQGFPVYIRPFLLGSSACLFAFCLVTMAAPSYWPLLWPPMALLAAAQGLVGARWLRWTRGVLERTRPLMGEMQVVREGLRLLGKKEFSSPKLRGLGKRIVGAEETMGKLDLWFFLIEQRSKDWWYALSLWLALGTQSAMAIEEWKKKHGEELRSWLDAWAEFDALQAIACYAYENPEDCWPEIAEGEAFFTADELGHPLLPREACVRNDVALGSPLRLWVISGSNMAGKSTLLRAMGLASVLALAGAPVRAARLRLAAMRVCASISIADSLREGKSKFLAEVERLRHTLDASLEQPVLFLIDEILSGTNSKDRLVAADAVVRTLIERRAIGAVSTHDVALAALARHEGENRHMASAGPGPLDFDYRVKAGVTEESNALAIARMAGVPV